MIQQLLRYYDEFMPDEAKIPYGYSRKEIAYVLEIDAEGNIFSFGGPDYVSLLDDDKKGKMFNVPDDYVPDNGFLPRFLYGRMGYMFHIPDKKGKFGWFNGQWDLHKSLLGDLAENGYAPAIAILRYFEKESKNVRVFTEDQVKELASGIFTFRYEGEYLFNDPEFKIVWEKSLQSGKLGRSAFSDNVGLILDEPHPKFGSSVIPGAGAGGTLVSRKKEIDAFKMELPLPSITRADVYKYRSALTYLMTLKEKRIIERKKPDKDTEDKSKRKKIKKVAISEDGDKVIEQNDTYTHYFYRTKVTEDLTILHWAEMAKPFDMEVLLGPDEDDAENSETLGNEELKEVFNRACRGVGFELGEQDPVVHIYGILGQQGRIRILFSADEFLNDLLVNSLEHVKRLKMVGLNKWASVFALLNSVLPEGASLKQYQALAQGMVLSVLTGVQYPEPLFVMAVERIKNAIVTEKFSIGSFSGKYIVALIQAMMIKNYNLEVRDMSVLESNTAYLLGRVYAAAWLTADKDDRENMDKVMQRWFRVAMETPAVAYAPYLQSARIHKANDFRIAEIMKEIKEPLPERLSVKEQGLWMLGFYHQYASHFKLGIAKKETTEAADGNNTDAVVEDSNEIGEEHKEEM